MSHSHAIQGLTLKPDVLVDDNDISDREVCNLKQNNELSLFSFLFSFLH